MPKPLDELVTPVAQGLAKPGGLQNPVLRYLAGLAPAGGGGSPSPAPPPVSPPAKPAPRRQAKARPDAKLMEQVMARFKTYDETGFARPVWEIRREGDAVTMGGMLPAEAALRPEALRNLRNQGLDPSMLDVSNMTPQEANYIRMVLNPDWVNNQLDPGASLSEADKADAEKRYGKP